MEIKDWLYEDFPEFTDNVDGVSVLPSDGKEIGVHYCPNIKYASEMEQIFIFRSCVLLTDKMEKQKFFHVLYLYRVLPG